MATVGASARAAACGSASAAASSAAGPCRWRGLEGRLIAARRRGGAARRRASLGAAPCDRRPRRCSTSSGISKGGSVQPMPARAAAISSRRAARRGRCGCPPWSARRGRSRCGRRSSTGRGSARAASIAAAICLGVVAVDGLDVPAAGGEAQPLVDRGRERGRAVDGDAVVVPEHDQPAEAEVAGEVDRLVADALPSGSRRRR